MRVAKFWGRNTKLYTIRHRPDVRRKNNRVKALSYRAFSVFALLVLLFAVAGPAGLYSYILNTVQKANLTPHALSANTKLDYAPAANSFASGSQPAGISAETAAQLQKERIQQTASKASNQKHIKLLSQYRSANSKAYLNADGSKTIVYTAQATSYQDSTGQWRDIDNSLVKGADGTWHTKSNAWTSNFGNSRTYGITISKDGQTFRLTPKDANNVSPSVSNKNGKQFVIYKNLWDGVNLQYEIDGSQVKESIYVTKSSATSKYDFAYSGANLSLKPGTQGTYLLDGAFAGFELAAPTVSTHGNGIAKTIGKVAQTSNGTLLSVALDSKWYSKLSLSDFPLLIDPTVVNTSLTSSYLDVTNTGGVCGPGQGCGNTVGHDTTNGVYWRFIYNAAIPTVAGQYLVGAKLHLEMHAPDGINNYGTTDSHPMTFDHASCTNTYDCVDPSFGEVSGSIGSSNDFELISIYQKALSLGVTNPSIVVRGDETSGNTFKDFDDTKTSISFTFETLPTQSTIDSTAPQDGGTAVSTQPLLASTAPSDPDGPGPIKYRYIIGTSKAVPANDPYHLQPSVQNIIADSGLQALPQWVAPSNVLQDGGTYYWEPIVYDNYTNAPQVYGPAYSFKVNLRNGKDSTQSFDANGPFSVDFATGNLNTSLATQSISALSGSIGLSLDYNSPQRSSLGLVGQYYNDPGGTLTFPSSGTAPALTRIDPSVSFNWGTDSPSPGVITSDHFLVRWSGYFVAPTAGDYQFGTSSDDRSRIFVNNGSTAYVDGWTTNPTNQYGSTITLTAGQVIPITYEYAEITGTASAQLLVKKTDGSITPQAIPNQWLQTGIQPIATPHGLLGHYYTDDGSHTFPTDPADPTRTFLTRTDTSLGINWGTGSPVPNGPTDNFMVRWTGSFTAPLTDTYTFGTGSDDGSRVIVNGSNTIVNAWSDHGSGPVVYASSGISLTKGQSIPITIEYYEHTGAAQFGLYVKQASLPSAPDTIVDSSWLTPQSQTLPDGWQVSGTSGVALNYDYAVIKSSAVTLYDSQGQSHDYTYTNNTFTPPVGEVGNMVRNGDGTITLQDGDSTTYVFNTDGTIQSATLPSDDSNPASLKYVYGSTNGSSAHLTQITDGVNSGRWIKVYYGSDPNCLTPPGGFNSQAPANMICAAISSDGAATKFYYTSDSNSIPRLARIEKPGGERYDYGYDLAGRITQVRDSLANDAVAAGVRSQDGTELSQVTYDALGRVASTTLPAATAGATRLSHSYVYNSPNNITMLHVANATEPNGFTRKVTYDGTYRTLTDTDIANLTKTTQWDSVKDLVLSSTNEAGLKTSNIYDFADRVTDTYGPAPAAWFGADNKPLTTPTDYASQIPHSQTGYDQGINGLATAYYDVSTASNGTGASTKVLFGNPKLHATSLGNTSGDINQTWNGTPPFTPDSDYGWGARLTGDIHFTSAGSYTFRLYSNDGVRLWVDDTLVIDDWNDGAPRSRTASFTNSSNPTDSWHKITLDYYNAAGHTNAQLQMFMTPPGGSETGSLGGVLTPLYGLDTTNTVYDSSASVGNTVQSKNYGTNPELDLLQSTSIDPTGLNLTTSNAYETPYQAGSFDRQTSKTLAGSTAIGYSYYGAAESRQNPCNTSQSFLQSGMQKLKTETDPDGTGAQTPRTLESVYDDAGRLIANRYNNDAWTCTTYDARGRVTKVVIPKPNGSTGRTINYNYAVGGNPLVSSKSDPTTVQTTVDLLGRTVAYKDSMSSTFVTGTTTTSYDNIGRMISISSPDLGLEEFTYDNFNRQINQKLDGVIYAASSYDAYGRLSQVTYPAAGQLKQTITYDNFGRPNNKSLVLGGGSAGPSDAVIYSQSGQVISGTELGQAKSYGYDAAGRLTSATIGANTYSYNYGTPTACTGNYNPNAGKNTDITSKTVNGATTTFCYDYADRLVSSSDITLTDDTYDAHGNLTEIGNFSDHRNLQFSYDESDRTTLIRQYSGGDFNIQYYRDVDDRITYRGFTGSGQPSSDTYFGYTDDSSSPSFLLNTSTAVIEKYLQLPGGMEMTVRPSATPAAAQVTYSASNIHGDIFATADANGNQTGTFTYDPYGKLTSSTSPANITGKDSFSWAGQSSKISEQYLYTPTIELGARIYLPTVGRFTTEDPVEGGCANNYSYTFGDPINSSDLTGEKTDCGKLAQAINAIRNELQQRYNELRDNKLNLPLTGKFSIQSHRDQFKQKQTNLRKNLNEYDKDDCNMQGGAKIASDSWTWATRSAPQPKSSSYNINMRNVARGALLIGGVAALGIFIYATGGTGALVLAGV